MAKGAGTIRNTGNVVGVLAGRGGENLPRGRAEGDGLYGGATSDLLLGQQGDFFSGRMADDDIIRDFVDGVDQIDLTAFGFRPPSSPQKWRRRSPARAPARPSSTSFGSAATGPC